MTDYILFKLDEVIKKIDNMNKTIDDLSKQINYIDKKLINTNQAIFNLIGELNNNDINIDRQTFYQKHIVDNEIKIHGNL